MNRQTILETERLVIVPIKKTDAPVLHTFWSDPAVTKFMNIDPLNSLSQTEEMIAFLLKLMAAEEATRYTIIIKETQEIIGTCGLNYLDQGNQRTEIAYDLGQAFWGKGYAYEALSAFVKWSIHHYNFHRLEAKIDPRNTGSIKLIEKLQFEREGILRDYEKIGTHYCDLIMYSYLAN